MQMKTTVLTSEGTVNFKLVTLNQLPFIPHTHSQEPHIKNYHQPDLFKKKKKETPHAYLIKKKRKAKSLYRDIYIYITSSHLY